MNKKVTKLISKCLIKRRSAYCIGGCILAISFSISPVFASGNITDAERGINAKQLETVKQADIVVRGLVKDEKGLPLPGASVKVKGSLISTATNINGGFSITVPSASSVLIVSFIGYDSKEVVVGNQTTISVQLVPSSNALEEVAVVGFGTQRKVSLIGAQSTINAKELKLPVSSVTQSLAGRITGVVGVQRSGEPGRSTADIWIRGIATFGGNSSAPLILVDGVLSGQSIILIRKI